MLDMADVGLTAVLVAAIGFMQVRHSSNAKTAVAEKQLMVEEQKLELANQKLELASRREETDHYDKVLQAYQELLNNKAEDYAGMRAELAFLKDEMRKMCVAHLEELTAVRTEMARLRATYEQELKVARDLYSACGEDRASLMGQLESIQYEVNLLKTASTNPGVPDGLDEAENTDE